MLVQILFNPSYILQQKKKLFNLNSIASKSGDHESPGTASQSTRTEHTVQSSEQNYCTG